ITRMKIKSISDMKNAAIKIQEMGAKNVIIKGGHLAGKDSITDILLADKKFHTYHHERMRFDSHGGGCTFSASLCANIAIGKDLVNATDSARLFTRQSMKNSMKIGRGIQITSIKDEIENELRRAIIEFCSIQYISEHIPECQTNFVYSKVNPSSLKDIIGLEGRIVKTGSSGTVAGNLKYGGSKHVASAVLEMTKKFPVLRSGINLKYDERIIRKAMVNGLKVTSYNRNKETRENKEKEGSTVSWGIKTAISNLQVAPDIVFHKGDFGKEAMIIVFGRNPEDVLKKTLKITQIHPST
ncbi:MAG: bifunctional hydroxymethylpyrimidine kinase/phosphomethylpyrimidine kinase, partial [Thaumarchaeota archaeon]|nr:bifunctional hydroxymethylpyrimidine kinase/phosphomethylpyrimidine kinase [Nitrososphaerota archaeon]